MWALTRESTGLVEKHIETHGMTYPVGAGTQGIDSYGSKGIPQAFLVDHTGTIIWVGRPWDTDWPERVDRALAQAALMADAWVVGEHPEFLDKAAALAAKGEMGKAWKESERLLAKQVELPQEIAHVRDFQTSFGVRVEAQDSYIESLGEAGRYQEASDYMKARIKVFKGSPAAKQWTVQLKSWGKDSAIKSMMKLDKKRLEAIEKAYAGDADKAKKALRALMAKAKGTALEATMESAYLLVAEMK